LSAALRRHQNEGLGGDTRGRQEVVGAGRLAGIDGKPVAAAPRFQMIVPRRSVRRLTSERGTFPLAELIFADYSCRLPLMRLPEFYLAADARWRWILGA